MDPDERGGHRAQSLLGPCTGRCANGSGRTADAPAGIQEEIIFRASHGTSRYQGGCPVVTAALSAGSVPRNRLRAAHAPDEGISSECIRTQRSLCRNRVCEWKSQRRSSDGSGSGPGREPSVYSGNLFADRIREIFDSSPRPEGCGVLRDLGINKSP